MKNSKYSIDLSLSSVQWEKVEKLFFSDKNDLSKRWKNHMNVSPSTKEILKLLAGGAVLGLSLVFPALPMAIAPFVVNSKSFNRKRVHQIVRRLDKQKLIAISEENGCTLVRISDKGRIRALRYKIDEMSIQKPKIWDRKWRVVIFDIPEKHKRLREIFRSHLKQLGFYQLQKSVWAHPYPCFDEVEFLRSLYRVAVNVSYIVAEKIDNSEELKAHFTEEF